MPAEHRVKVKEAEKLDKSLDLARELKKQFKIKVMYQLLFETSRLRGTGD